MVTDPNISYGDRAPHAGATLCTDDVGARSGANRKAGSTRSPGASPVSPPGRWVTACTAVALGATLLATEPVRAHARHATVSAPVAWSAAPAAAALESIPPAVACPAACVGTPPPARTSRIVTEVACAAVRRTLLSRYGGRYGP